MDRPAPTRPGRDLRVFAGALALIVALPLGAAWWPAADSPTRLEHLTVGYALAGLPYLVVCARWRRAPTGVRGFWLMVACAALSRLLLATTIPPLLSEDLWRYLWDGLVQHAGLDPFAHPPTAAALDGVVQNDAIAILRSQIGHPQIPTIYPPAAQGAFYLATLGGAAPGPLRWLLALADAGTCAALWTWAQRSGRRPTVAWLYAFAPVPLLESSVGSHVDALGVAGMVAAGAWLATGQRARAGVAWAVGVGVKLLPLIAVPALLRRAPAAALVGLVTLAALYGVYYSPDLFGGLQAYGHRWRANDGAFALLVEGFSRLWPDTGVPVELPEAAARLIRRAVGPNGHSPDALIWPDEAAFGAAKLVAAAVLGATWLAAVARGFDYERLLLVGVATLLLVSPVVHPWYLMWALPLALLAIAAGRATGWPLVVWSLLVWIAYLPRPDYLRTGTWSTSLGWRLVEYSPVWLGVSLAVVGPSILRRLGGPRAAIATEHEPQGPIEE